MNALLVLYLFYFISRHHRDDDVPISLICSSKSSWLRLFLVCHQAVGRRSIHLLLLLRACHRWTPLKCGCRFNIIISFASWLQTQSGGTLIYPEMHFSPSWEGPTHIDLKSKCVVFFPLWPWKQPLCASLFKMGIKFPNLGPNQRLHTSKWLDQQRSPQSANNRAGGGWNKALLSLSCPNSF